jgi:CRP-like cAMP-binding protein/rhodanese-related sulfurtransferase
MSGETVKENAFSRNPLFADIPKSIVHEITQIAQEKVVPAHTIVFRQGDPGDSFYIINSGAVRVFRKGREGVEIELARLGQGDSFGEIALLTGEPRSGYVEALEKTHLTVISKDQFDQILKNHPDISSVFLKKLSNLLVRSDLRLVRESERQVQVPGLSLVALFIIIGLSLLFGISSNLSNPHGIPLIPKSLSLEPIPTVTNLQAFEKYKEGKALFIDARPSNFFKQKHIKGALNIPLALFDIAYLIELGEGDREKEIIIYGKTLSHLYDEQAAEKLILRGHTNTKILQGGLSIWEKSGYPLEP